MCSVEYLLCRHVFRQTILLSLCEDVIYNFCVELLLMVAEYFAKSCCETEHTNRSHVDCVDKTFAIINFSCQIPVGCVSLTSIQKFMWNCSEV